MTLFTPRRLSVTTLAIMAGWLTVVTPSLAQQQRVSNPGDGRSSGMRYLTWPGKVEHPRASASVAAPAAEPRDDAEGRGPILSMPSQPLVPPVATRYSARTSPGPTPASAWVSGGSTAPAYGAPPPSTFAAPYDARTAMMPEPPRGFAPAPPLTPPAFATPARATPVYAPPRDEAPRPETPAYDAAPMDAPRYQPPRAAYVEDRAPPPALPVYAPPEATPGTPGVMPAEARRAPVAADTGPATMSPAEPVRPATAEAPVADPYAPRPDAPIFRMLNRNSQPAPAPVASQPSDAPAAAGPTRTPPAQAAPAPAPYPAAASDADRSPRRYSVHRANGQSPDRVPLPDPVLLDSAPVDLAEPPEAPTVVRNINGRLTAINPASEDPSQP